MSNIQRSTPGLSVTHDWNHTVEQTRSKSVSKFDFLKPTPMKSKETLLKSREQFGKYFQESMEKMGSELKLSPEKSVQLREKTAIECGKILSEAFDSKGVGKSKISKAEYNQAVKTAHMRAQQAILSLRTEFNAPQLAPQIVPMKTENGVKFAVIKPAPPFENLVLRGGGAKGIGNGAALMELEKAGTLAGLKHIVGTSAGALTAVGLASGMTAAQFNDFSANTDIESLKNTPKNFATTYPMVNMGMRVGYTAGTALALLDKTSAENVQGRLKTDANWNKVVRAYEAGTIDKAAFERLTELRKDPDFTSNRSGKMVTFGDLRTMAKVFPGEVKELTLTGTNRTDQQLTYFNADSHPDMPIAVAGRISMSIPFYFASVSYDAGGGTKTWVDGGVGSNMPAGAVLDGLRKDVETAKSDLDKAHRNGDRQGIGAASARLDKAMAELEHVHSRTLLMTFDEGGKGYQKMHNPGKEPKAKLGRLDKFKGNVAGDKKWVANQQKDAKNIRDAGPNVVVVHHGNIGTLDLDASQKRVDEAALESQMRVLERAVQHRDEATYDVFGSTDQVVSSFTQHDREMLIAAGPPKLDDFKSPGRTDLEALELFTQVDSIYQRVKEEM